VIIVGIRVVLLRSVLSCMVFQLGEKRGEISTRGGGLRYSKRLPLLVPI
jgi:hypothetical protein